MSLSVYKANILCVLHSSHLNAYNIENKTFSLDINLCCLSVDIFD